MPFILTLVLVTAWFLILAGLGPLVLMMFGAAVVGTLIALPSTIRKQREENN